MNTYFYIIIGLLIAICILLYLYRLRPYKTEAEKNHIYIFINSYNTDIDLCVHVTSKEKLNDEIIITHKKDLLNTLKAKNIDQISVIYIGYF
jgi:uncharacterized membrane protein YgaE (UPF0421/DUF939 family)